MKSERAVIPALSLIPAMCADYLTTTLIFLARSGRFLSAEPAMRS